MRAHRYVIPDDLDVHTKQWLERVYSLVRPRSHLRPLRDSTALVVVDMIRYFAHPDGTAYLPAVEAILPRIEMLLSGAASLKIPVIMTRHCNTPENASSLGRFFGNWIGCGEESEIIDTLREKHHDAIVLKHTYDSFLGTGLDSFLKERDISTLIVTGVLTNLCVETTARSAFVRGYDVLVPADATASNLEELHVSSLLSLASGIARIVTVQEVLDELGV